MLTVQRGHAPHTSRGSRCRTKHKDGVSHADAGCSYYSSGVGGCNRAKGFCQCSARTVPKAARASDPSALLLPSALVTAPAVRRTCLQRTLSWTAGRVAGLGLACWLRSAQPAHLAWCSAMVQGDDCDPGFTGAGCSERERPMGEDPRIHPGWGTRGRRSPSCARPQSQSALFLFSVKSCVYTCSVAPREIHLSR